MKDMNESLNAIEVYQEMTPNPESMKFVTNRHLLPNGIFETSKEGYTGNSPLAEVLFEVNGVVSVFISQHFVTVTKQKEEDWFELSPMIREVVRKFLATGTPAVKEQNQSNVSATATVSDGPEQRIAELLDKYVRPAVEMDGGHIAFDSFSEGVVKLKLQGSCSGCPSSAVTLKNGIEGLLKRMVPEVQSVEAIND